MERAGFQSAGIKSNRLLDLSTMVPTFSSNLSRLLAFPSYQQDLGYTLAQPGGVQTEVTREGWGTSQTKDIKLGEESHDLERIE